MQTGPLHATLQHLRRAAGEDGGVSDAQLLERFVRHREETAFELLVWRHERLVLAACRRILRDPHDADDAFQATFLALARQAGSIGRGEALAGWLHRVACRAALRLRSRNSARARHETHAPWDSPQAPDDPAEEAVWDDLRPLLDEEVGRLPEKYRVAVVLCYLEGLTYDEAARRLGCPRGTVSIRLTRARDLLRKRLVRRGIALSGAALAAVLCAHAARAGAPKSFVNATVRAALAFAADRAAAVALVSARTVALAEGVLRAMWMTKVKVALALLFAAAVVVGLGAGALAQRADSGKAVDLLPGQKDRAPDPPKKEADGDKPLDLLPGSKPKPADSGKAETPAGGEGWREWHDFPSPGGDVMGVAFSPDGKRLAVAGQEGQVDVWDLPTAKLLDSSKIEVIALQSLAFSPDGKVLAVGGSGKKGGHVLFLDPAAGGKPFSVSEFPDTVTCVVFSPDGRLAAVTGADKSVRLLHVPSGKEVRSFAGHADVVFTAAFSPDGKLLATGGGPSEVKAKPAAGDVHLWDVSTGKEVANAKTEGTVTCVAFSPDGRTLAVGSFDNLVRLWDVPSMKAKADLKGHEFLVRSVAWSPDGRTLATAGFDETVRLWDVATGKEVAVLKGQKGAIQTVRFSPDGRLLATGSDKLRFKDKDEGKPLVKVWEVGRPAARDLSVPPGKDKAGADWTDGLIKELSRPERGDRQVAEGLYLATLGRFPTEEETKVVLDHLKGKKGREEALLDLVFALTNSKEYGAHLEEMSRRDPRAPKK
jgi:RNA polymerase sigma factor (sigma-70 family)